MKRDIELALASAQKCMRQAGSFLSDVGALIERGAPEVAAAAEPIKEALGELVVMRKKIDTAAKGVSTVFHEANVKRLERRKERNANHARRSEVHRGRDTTLESST